MKKIYLIIVIMILISIVIASILILNTSITGNAIQNSPDLDSYMYTKAVCNESNFCQDNEITCQGNKIVSIIPITGAVVQHSDDWQDPRSKEQQDKIC
ncbi:Uncharacterised protein [uncultured archaeon]|nr:Uncharacterised protein [uncultured archaeon]